MATPMQQLAFGNNMPPSPSSSRVSSLSSAVSTLAIGDYQDYFRAIHPYDPPAARDNPRTKCLALQPGTLLYIHHVHESGWADGSTLAGERGWFPSNFCEPFLPAPLRALAVARDATLSRIRASDGRQLGSGVQSMVAEVRALLENAGCLSRAAVVVQSEDMLRRQRKLLLHELSLLTKALRRSSIEALEASALDLTWHVKRVYKASARFLYAAALAGVASISPNASIRASADLLTPVSMDFSGMSLNQEDYRGAHDRTVPRMQLVAQEESAVTAVNQLREVLLSSLSRLSSESQLMLKFRRPGTIGSILRDCADNMRSFLVLVEALNGKWRDRKLAKQVQQLYHLVTVLVTSTRSVADPSITKGSMEEVSEHYLSPQINALIRAVNECIARLQDLFSVYGDFQMQVSDRPVAGRATRPPADSEKAAEMPQSRTLPRDVTASSLASSNATESTVEIESQVRTLDIPRKAVAKPQEKPRLHPALPLTPATPATPTFDGPSVRLADAGNTFAGLVAEEGDHVIQAADGRLIGASLPALIRRLTPHDQSPDAKLVNAFMLTFRLFCTPDRLAQALLQRFVEPTEVDDADAQPDKARIHKLICLRTFNIVKRWLETYWQPATDEVARSMIETMAQQYVVSLLPGHESRLQALLIKAGQTRETQPSRSNTTDSASKPRLSRDLIQKLSQRPRDSVPLAVLDFDGTEIARQLTLIESRIFCAIEPHELLGQEFEKPAADSKSVHVKQMSAMSTDLAAWVADSILSETEQGRRSKTLSRWISVSQACVELQNYNALFAVVCALASSTISRLKRTWNGLSAADRQLFDELKQQTEHDRNYSEYRQRLRLAVPPCLPFVGLFLTDLSFITQGNPDARTIPARMSGNAVEHSSPNGGKPLTAPVKVINVDKYARIGAVLGDVQRFQVDYNLEPVPAFQDWLLERLATTKQLGNDLYRRSLVIEPKASHAMQRHFSESSNTSSAAPALIA